MIKNLIWDFDGTLFDTYPAFTQAFVSALEGFGHSVDPAYISRLAHIGLGYCATQLSDQYDLVEEEVMQAFQVEYSRIDYRTQELMPHALDLCKLIVRSSGANVIVTHRGRKSTLALLQAHDVEYLFQDILTGDDGYPRKPDPAGIEAIIKRNDFVKDYLLVVGDRELDAEVGRLAGVRMCILGNDDRNITATYSVSNLKELNQIILSENT